MRIVIGIDWSDQAFAAVPQTFHAYRPSDVTLVHGVDLGVFKYPIVAQAANLQGYDDFRNAMVDADRQLPRPRGGHDPSRRRQRETGQ